MKWSYEEDCFEKANLVLHDIITEKKQGKRLIVEVKGSPSGRYISDFKKEKKASPNFQAKRWFSKNFFSNFMCFY